MCKMRAMAVNSTKHIFSKFRRRAVNKTNGSIMCWHSNCLCNINLRSVCVPINCREDGLRLFQPFWPEQHLFHHTSTAVHRRTGGEVSQRDTEQQSSAKTLSCCVCWILRLHRQPLTPMLTGDLCVGQVWPIRYLRGDTGTPAHALLTAPSWGCPPHCLGAVL